MLHLASKRNQKDLVKNKLLERRRHDHIKKAQKWKDQAKSDQKTGSKE